MRVTHKGDLKKYENNRGRSTIFAFDFLDARDCQILAPCISEVAEHFHTLIETGNIYLVLNGTVKKVVKDYNPLPR